ncbi:SURP and G-patch domain-containing protein 2 isoform X2 [Protopterus annectens]|uniref:SURP and G-patch domain-containing protein 2 isoform X2 n=1 Tax=Protopterus annectens TaxID=7888 RepID=UPI001CFC29B6|nr:SURP and G-patch domain-containing protein 2 isoform X2 [Protopterus annectens]
MAYRPRSSGALGMQDRARLSLAESQGRPRRLRPGPGFDIDPRDSRFAEYRRDSREEIFDRPLPRSPPRARWSPDAERLFLDPDHYVLDRRLRSPSPHRQGRSSLRDEFRHPDLLERESTRSLERRLGRLVSPERGFRRPSPSDRSYGRSGSPDRGYGTTRSLERAFGGASVRDRVPGGSGARDHGYGRSDSLERRGHPRSPERLYGRPGMQDRRRPGSPDRGYGRPGSPEHGYGRPVSPEHSFARARSPEHAFAHPSPRARRPVSPDLGFDHSESPSHEVRPSRSAERVFGSPDHGFGRPVPPETADWHAEQEFARRPSPESEARLREETIGQALSILDEVLDQQVVGKSPLRAVRKASLRAGLRGSVRGGLVRAAMRAVAKAAGRLGPDRSSLRGTLQGGATRGVGAGVGSGTARVTGQGTVKASSKAPKLTQEQMEKLLNEDSDIFSMFGNQIIKWAGFHTLVNETDTQRHFDTLFTQESECCAKMLAAFKCPLNALYRDYIYRAFKPLKHKALKTPTLDEALANMLVEKGVLETKTAFLEMVKPFDKNMLKIQDRLLRCVTPLLMACNAYEWNVKTQSLLEPTDFAAALEKTVSLCRKSVILLGQTFSLATQFRQEKVLELLGLQDKAPNPSDFPNFEDSTLFGREYLLNLEAWLKKSAFPIKINLASTTGAAVASLAESTQEQEKVKDLINQLIKTVQDPSQKNSPAYRLLFNTSSEEHKIYKNEFTEIQRTKVAIKNKFAQTVPSGMSHELAPETVRALVYGERVAKLKRSLSRSLVFRRNPGLFLQSLKELKRRQRRRQKTVATQTVRKRAAKPSAAKKSCAQSAEEMAVDTESPQSAKPGAAECKVHDPIRIRYERPCGRPPPQKKKKAKDLEFIDKKLTDANRGYKMLSKMGWRSGEGLGTGGHGIKDPIKVFSGPLPSASHLITKE